MKTASALTASELRIVLGRLVRRLRAEGGFPLSQAAVLGRLDREGGQSVSDLAASERVRPQSMAQTVAELESTELVSRRPDPGDRRRQLVELTVRGRDRLAEDRRRRIGWLSEAIASDLSAEEQEVLEAALPLLERLTEH